MAGKSHQRVSRKIPRGAGGRRWKLEQCNDRSDQLHHRVIHILKYACSSLSLSLLPGQPSYSHH